MSPTSALGTPLSETALGGRRAPGILVPPLTPFSDKGRIDHAALREQIEYIVGSCEPEMVVAAGVEAQEYQCLSRELRVELIRATCEYVDGRVPVSVGISHPSVNAALELADLAAELGAATVQLLAPRLPFGGEPSTSELVAYFDYVTTRSPLDVGLYLNPGPGASVSMEATVELCAIDGVVYVKESSRDISRVGLLILEIDQTGLARYYTTMQILLASVELGASGATMPPPAAEIAARILRALSEGNQSEAIRLQRQFRRFPLQWSRRYGLSPVLKAAMGCLDRDVGEPYPPYSPLPQYEIDAMREELASLDLTRGA